MHPLACNSQEIALCFLLTPQSWQRQLLGQFKKQQDGCSHDFANNLLFHIIHDLEAELIATGATNLQFKLRGRYVCRACFKRLLGIGSPRLNRLLAARNQINVPMDLRHFNGSK